MPSSYIQQNQLTHFYDLIIRIFIEHLIQLRILYYTFQGRKFKSWQAALEHVFGPCNHLVPRKSFIFVRNMDCIVSQFSSYVPGIQPEEFLVGNNQNRWRRKYPLHLRREITELGCPWLASWIQEADNIVWLVIICAVETVMKFQSGEYYTYVISRPFLIIANEE